MTSSTGVRLIASLTIAIVALAAPNARASSVVSLHATAAQSGPQEDGTASAFSSEELEAIAAPIALYPDSLLSQIFMASTYPLEIVEADRWAKAHPDMKGDAAAKDLEAQKWDPSVKSLVNFPQVLDMMSSKLDWTQKLGDAFIGQQKDIMAAVQRLRAKAKEAGTLKDSKEQNVEVQGSGSQQTIVIEQADPSVIYVPSYNPTVVYGTWPYPAYPPYPVYPPGYVASNVLSFTAGVACGLAWGYAWGHCDWNRADVNINVNQNSQFNRNINRTNTDIRNGNWQHNPSHRDGVGYRDKASAQKFGGRTTAETQQARSDFRGRAQEGRNQISRGDADAFKGNQPRGGAGAGDGGARRDGGQGMQGGDRRGAAAQRSTPSQNRSNAFSGSNGGGREARSASSRGHSSMNRSSGGSRGGSRGGGGARGGGGRR